MTDLPFIAWALILAALVLGILAGHFGWGRRWPGAAKRLHPDYLTGLDYLVTEQPDRALDVFLKLADASADTLETHFALGSLYRRRGEVERAIRLHQNLLARAELAPVHREQALLALAQDYLHAGLLDRAEGLFRKVSESPRLKVSALAALRSVYERQGEWQQALGVFRALKQAKAAPPPTLAAHYLCELAAAAIERGDAKLARSLLREARTEVKHFPRAALLRAHLAEREGDGVLAVRLLHQALLEAPQLLQEELPHWLALMAAERREGALRELADQARAHGPEEEKRLVFAAIAAGWAAAAPLHALLERVFAADPVLAALAGAAREEYRETAARIAALLEHAEKYRCADCGFSARSFYWHCPACHAWDTFEAYTRVTLR